MEDVIILESGPRDGFQNLSEVLDTKTKLEIIDGLIQSGIKAIEVTSFVSPKAIPQMIDAKEVAEYCVKKYSDVELYALVPNLKGAQLAYAAGIKSLSYVISLSKSHNKANINRTHEESFEELAKMIAECPEVKICVGIATAFGCPFEGLPKVEETVAFAQKIYDMGIRSLNLADTIGIADPKQVRETIRAIKKDMPDCELQIHIHDTRNMGIVNTLAAIEEGVNIVQTTLGGLGGCPFAPGASGNTATEDLVYMLDRMDIKTGVNFEELLALSKKQKEQIDGVYSGHQLNITRPVAN